MRGKKVEILGRTFVNCTSHNIDMYDAMPNSLNERRVMFVLEKYEELGGEWEDEITHESGLLLVSRKLKVKGEDIKKLLEKIKQEFGAEINLIVSLPVLLHNKEKIKSISSILKMNIRPVSIISATKRNVKPPVACMRYWSV